jgi:hypothetical protein
MGRCPRCRSPMARHLRRCHNQVVLLRRRRQTAEWRAGVETRRRARQAEIRRSLADLHDRLASRDRFAAELVSRGLTPG